MAGRAGLNHGTLVLALLAAGFAPAALCQESDFGISVPVTAGAGALDSPRLQLSNPAASRAAFGFRVMLYPTLKLGKHWFAYAAVQTRLVPYFYYDAFLPGRGLTTDVVQGYAGYTVQQGRSTLVVKAGRLVSAFGSFPLRYDDMDNPVLDQPLSYMTELPIRTDQLVCGTADLLRQHYGSVAASCGGAVGRAGGLTPVTLYGLPGVQAEVSVRQFDARLQVTSGSPAYPASWRDFRQYAQWTAGLGYTIRQGFRVGASAFTGPYLEPEVLDALPPGTAVRDFPVTGMGLDAQWARGRWSLFGEWQRIRFDLPHFVVSPSIDSGYGEAKSILTPRLYVAGRAGWLRPGRVTDTAGITASRFAPTLTSYELAAGFWLNRHQLVKASYSWLFSAGETGIRYDVYGIALITRFTPPALSFR
jgi:hypothetical protein